MKLLLPIFAAALFGFAHSALAQGFVNMDFEDATIAPTPPGGSIYPADLAQCFPGWTVGGSGTVIMYNDLSLGAPAVILMGPDFPNFTGFSPLQGSYSVLLYYDNPSILTPPTLSQTARVSINAKSINFLTGYSGTDLALTMNGINVPLVSMAGGRLAGDISAFADDIVQLTFTVSPSRTGGIGIYFDDIQFSSSPVPEPSLFALGTLGALAFACRRIQRPFR